MTDQRPEGEEEPKGSSLPATPEDALRWRANPILLQARFPDDLRDPTTLAQFAQVAIAINLNPLMGELVPFHGRPYITEEGWLRMIDERAPGQLVRDETSIASEAEYKMFGVSNGWLGKAVITRRMLTQDGRTTADRVVTDYAFLSKKKVEESRISAITDEPWRQAMKTAHVRALRKAFRDVVARSASDFALGGTSEENIIDVDVMKVVGKLAESGAEQTTEDTERKKFWSRAPKLGFKHGSVELAAFLGLDAPSSSIKAYWIDLGHTWMELNQMLDTFESAGVCAQCGKGYTESLAYTADAKGICSAECKNAYEKELEPTNDGKQTAGRTSRAGSKK